MRTMKWGFGVFRVWKGLDPIPSIQIKKEGKMEKKELFIDN